MTLFACKQNHSSQEGVDPQKTTHPFFILMRYNHLKDALVEGNQEKAAKAGETVKIAIENFDTHQFASVKNDLANTMKSAISEAEQISKSPLEKQREQFNLLSQNLIKLIKITGTIKKLYVDYCPKYQNGKGGVWLSELKEIQNPYFGNKLLDCGQIKETFNQ